MATTRPLPSPSSNAEQQPAPGGGDETVDSQALVTLSPDGLEQPDPNGFSAPVVRLPVELDVAVPVREFRVRNLLALQPGQLIESQWGHGDDVPLASGEVQLAWSEFEVIGTQLAVRVTRLA